MNKVALFCKSYRDDVLRAKRLARSVERFNMEGLPLYVSVPSSDLALFQEHCAGLPLTLISDEEIVAANPGLDLKAFAIGRTTAATKRRVTAKPAAGRWAAA